MPLIPPSLSSSFDNPEEHNEQKASHYTEKMHKVKGKVIPVQVLMA
jgi:hypothetical protein